MTKLLTSVINSSANQWREAFFAECVTRWESFTDAHGSLCHWAWALVAKNSRPIQIPKFKSNNNVIHLRVFPPSLLASPNRYSNIYWISFQMSRYALRLCCRKNAKWRKRQISHIGCPSDAFKFNSTMLVNVTYGTLYNQVSFHITQPIWRRSQGKILAAEMLIHILCSLCCLQMVNAKWKMENSINRADQSECHVFVSIMTARR